MYIDIHTHREYSNDKTELQVRSHYEQFFKAAKGMPCSIGLHPWYLQDSENGRLELWEFAKFENVLAIGECGLDKVCKTDWDLQLAVFRDQIELAKEFQKPLIIHCVRALVEVVQLIVEINPRVPVVFHGYNSSSSFAKLLLAGDFYFSFGAAIMKSKAAVNSLKLMPSNMFFCETDDADVSITDIYQRAAEIRGVSVNEIILQVEENFRRIFKYKTE